MTNMRPRLLINAQKFLNILGELWNDWFQVNRQLPKYFQRGCTNVVTVFKKQLILHECPRLAIVDVFISQIREFHDLSDCLSILPSVIKTTNFAVVQELGRDIC